jgi:glutamyl-tRNA synthetase
MGYALPDGREIFTFDEMVDTFDWSRVNPVGPVFDLDKLQWLNGHYIRDLPVEDLATRMVPYLQAAGLVGEPIADAELQLLYAATPLVQERIGVLSEAPDMLGFLFTEGVEIDPQAAEKARTDAPVLPAAIEALEPLPAWATADIQAALRAALVDRLGLKPRQAFGPVRVAVTGRSVSPPLFESMELLGRERSLARLRAAL